MTDPVRVPSAISLVTANFLSLGLGEAVARIVAFLATVYVARVLGASYFGMTAFAAAVILYLGRVVDGGLDSGLGIRLIASKRNRIERLGVTLLAARLAGAAILFMLLSVVGLLLFPQPDGLVLATYGLLLFPIALSSRWIHLGLERARFASAARIAGELTMLLLVFALVRAPGDVVMVPLAQFAGDTLGAALLIGCLFWWGYRPSLSLRSGVLRPVLRQATPLVSASLLALLIYNSDLLLLRLFRDTAAVGHYVAAYALISFLGNLTGAYGAALLPTLARLRSRRDEKVSLYQTAMAQVLAVAFPVTVGGILVAPQIIRSVFGAGYGAAVLPLQILLCSTTLGVVREVASIGLIAHGREDRLLAMNAWGAGFNVSANLLAIPLFGMVGAAAATVATDILRIVIAQTSANREGLWMVSPARLWRPVLAVTFMAVGLVLMGRRDLWIALPAGLILYSLAMLATGGLKVQRGGPPKLSV